MAQEIELRTGVPGRIEVRTEGGDQSPTLVGYAAVFNQESEDLGGFREIIRPGAFKQVLAEGEDVLALFNHDMNYILGRTINETLVLEEDGHGLRYEVKPRHSDWTNDLIEAIRRGDVRGNSFSFLVGEAGQRWSKRKDGSILREITEVDRLRDVGPVTLPAYKQTAIVARSVIDAADSLRAQDEVEAQKVKLRAQHALKRLDIEEISSRRILNEKTT